MGGQINYATTGILLCEPSPDLEDYYKSFGFEYISDDEMFASIERLNDMQTRLNEAIGS
tara:strand:+ start:35 stop:211 length:177 start_codon:yes stop_codon:yes gene_type:complete